MIRENILIEKNQDLERENILKRVKDYFLEAEKGYEESGTWDEKNMGELNSIIDDMDNNDYNSAHVYFEEEINRLNKRILEVSDTEIGMEHSVPKIKEAIKELEKLRDSLHLSEKQ